jgi:hypothetical protein
MSDEEIQALRRAVAAGDEGARSTLLLHLVRAGRPLDGAWEGSPFTWTGGSLERAMTIQLDLAHLDTRRLLRNMPRDAGGELSLGEAVHLARYGPDRWLTATAPARRRDPQVIALSVEDPKDETTLRHRWLSARWFWDSRVPVDPGQLWGCEGMTGARIPPASSDQEALIADLRGRGELERVDKIVLTTLLQLQGRIEEAFALWDVHLAHSFLEALAGRHRSGGHEQPEESHASMVAFTRTCAPWRFAKTLRDQVADLAKSSKPPPAFRVFGLPPGHRHTQRPAIMLGAREANGDRPWLFIEDSGSLRCQSEHTWKRPLLSWEARPDRAKKLRAWYPSEWSP